MTDDPIAVKSNSFFSHQFECLVGTLPGVVYTLDDKGFFTSLSNKAETTLGTSAESLLGQHFSVIIHPDDLKSISREHILPHFRGVPTGNYRSPKLFDERRTWPRKTDSLVVRLSSNPFSDNQNKRVLKCKVNASGQYDKKQQFRGTMGIMYDISEDVFIPASGDKRTSYNAFELLTSALSHVFSNVFTGIYGNLQLIEMQLDKPDEFQDNIEAIKHSVENAVTLIRKLAQTVADSEKLRDSGYSQLLESAAHELFTGTGITYTTSYKENLWTPEADPAYLQHIVRAICYHIARSVRDHENIIIATENISVAPIKLPRHDCAYIMTNFSFSSRPPKPFDSALDQFSSLERIASMALSYELLKKIGGHVRVDESNGMSAVQLFLPAVR